jgi:predicted transcriptional regulator
MSLPLALLKFMAQSRKGKTETIKQRAIYVYLPSLEMVQEWKERSKKAGTSISKFVTELVEDSIRREEGEEGYTSRLELIEGLRKHEEELKKLREDNRLLRKLVDNLDGELKRYRAQPFLEDDFQGVRSFDRELIQLLREGELFSDDEILTRLNISPTDTDMMKAVSKQLQTLESYGLVEFRGRGWKWSE